MLFHILRNFDAETQVFPNPLKDFCNRSIIAPGVYKNPNTYGDASTMGIAAVALGRGFIPSVRGSSAVLASCSTY